MSLEQEIVEMPDPVRYGPIKPVPKYESNHKFLEDLNRLPLFMTHLDTSDGEGGANSALEALQALAYEGSCKEIMQNFKEQGNEQFRFKRYRDAVEYYNKALQAKDSVPEEEAEIDISAIDADVEQKKAIDELTIACFVNRAACNLELSKHINIIKNVSIIYMVLS